MFDRFTDRARNVMGLARKEAQRLNHAYIGTEHILLGLVQEEAGVAVSALRNLDVDPKKIRYEVESLVNSGTTTVGMGQIPFTPRAKRVLELTLEEATSLGHTYIGTEHILLGLILENEGIAAQALRTLKVRIEDVRDEVLEILGVDPQQLPDSDDTPVITLEVRQACRRAYAMASERGRLVGPLELLFGLLDLRNPEIEALLAQWNVDLEGLRKNVAGRIDGPPPAEPSEESR